ncbi:peptidoglycan-binding protein [Alkalihalobacillus pseudalcaliphilus]|uniref:peptidoglycan-binding protein n=1 Tax=Alkalihalobacillus pseudalcaliphilus TaxID=79884 RepID=UPI00064DFB6C|nr:peptidoglycan-binding protein [Alkalihalobacillus pseudalcaliphilus]KMK76583.1 hypothetical protein AB990_15570 [Alkalihalobacillus pseudalcaliphilus]
MKKKSTSRLLQRMGLPLAAAGLFILFSPEQSYAHSEGKNELLQKGMEGSQIEELQEKLAERGYFVEEDITGLFEEETQNAIKQFQKENDLLVDGLVGPQTLGAITVLRIDDEGSLVKALQETLSELDYFDGDVNGQYNKETKEAVLAAQKEFEIGIDGIAGPETFSAIYNAIYKSELEAVAPTQTSQPNESEVNESNEQTESEPSEQDEQEGQTLSVEATAYTAECEGCSGITATGINLLENRDKKVIAVDPTVIPLGSTVYVEGYGEAIAGDTGGAIKGNKIDLHMPTKDEAIQFGRQQVQITILD